jgi:hypothetical protein
VIPPATFSAMMERPLGVTPSIMALTWADDSPPPPEAFATPLSSNQTPVNKDGVGICTDIFGPQLFRQCLVKYVTAASRNYCNRRFNRHRPSSRTAKPAISKSAN